MGTGEPRATEKYSGYVSLMNRGQWRYRLPLDWLLLAFGLGVNASTCKRRPAVADNGNAIVSYRPGAVTS